MLRKCRQHARVTVSAAVTAVAVMLCATCMSAAGMTPEQKACCESMQHGCGEMAVQSSCCVGEVHADSSLAATKPSVGTVPISVLAAILTTRVQQPLQEVSRPVVETSSPGPPGIPTYLFVSSFRI